MEKLVFIFDDLLDFASEGRELFKNHSRYEIACETLFDNIIAETSYNCDAIKIKELAEDYKFPFDLEFLEILIEEGVSINDKKIIEVFIEELYADDLYEINVSIDKQIKVECEPI